MEADITHVINSNEIFVNLHGNAFDYDMQLFDILAEIRLVKWARENGYNDIEKIERQAIRTPDFYIKKDGKM